MKKLLLLLIISSCNSNKEYYYTDDIIRTNLSGIYVYGNNDTILAEDDFSAYHDAYFKYLKSKLSANDKKNTTFTIKNSNGEDVRDLLDSTHISIIEETINKELEPFF